MRRGQDAGAHGLCHEVVRAEIQAQRLIDLRIARGHEDDRQLGVARAHAAAHGVAVEFGHGDIAERDVRRQTMRERVERLGAVVGTGEVRAHRL